MNHPLRIINSKRFLLIGILCVLGFLINGFGQEEKNVSNSDASQATDSPEAPKVEEDKSAVPINFETALDYRYEPIGKRDPFRPFRDSKVGVGLIRSSNRPLEPLEKFDLKSLEVVAIVWSNEKPKALIQDPEKGIHSVLKGQRIGKNEGYVAEIREGEVVIVELYELNGQIIKEPYVLCIDKSKGCGT